MEVVNYRKPDKVIDIDSGELISKEEYEERQFEDEDEEYDDDDLVDYNPQGSIMSIGEHFDFGDEEYPMTCVYKTKQKGNEYALLHPDGAPDDIQFVIMRLDGNQMKHENDVDVCELIIRLYRRYRKRQQMLSGS